MKLKTALIFVIFQLMLTAGVAISLLSGNGHLAICIAIVMTGLSVAAVVNLWVSGREHKGPGVGRLSEVYDQLDYKGFDDDIGMNVAVSKSGEKWASKDGINWKRAETALRR